MTKQRATPATTQPDTGPHDTGPHDTVMDDFVFGGIEADDSRLLTDLRRRASGLRHRHTLHPRNPQPGEAVVFTLYVGPDVVVDRVTAYVTFDGSKPRGARGVAERGLAIDLTPIDPEWNMALWDYVGVWQGTIPAQAEGTFVQYMIEGWRSYDPTFSGWSSELNLDGTVERPTRYGYVVDMHSPPTWARDGVIYQIFVDRFTGHRATNRHDHWLTPEELNQFTGGTIRGVQEKLDYLADLGISIIWLSPIFTAISYHAYDTVDYYEIDPRFGTKAELRALVAAAHRRGIRVILDFVANHTGTTFPPFVEAEKGNQAYRDWFTFDASYPHGYRTFFGVAAMPQLNTDTPAVSRYLCEAAVYWLTEFDVDGYRLDYAAGPSHAFWSEFQAACKIAKADCWLFGEATLAGYDLRSYQGRLDGCLDFSFCRLIRQLCTLSQPQISLGTFLNHLRHGHAFFGNAFLRPAFLDNHDMNRFLWMAGNDRTQLRLALALLFSLGGPPILYYGTEVGLSQPHTKGPWREEARHPMRWAEEEHDQPLLAYCKEWIAWRRHHPALSAGALTILQLDEQQNVGLVERHHGTDRVLIAMNLGDAMQRVSLPAGAYRCAAPVHTTIETSVEIPGRSVLLLVPQ